jgi:uncharacterized protein YlxW (UPF0749 family)
VTILRSRLSLTIVCFLFGLAIVLQLRTQSRLVQSPSADSSTDLAAMAANLYDSNSALRTEVETLQVARYQNNRAPSAAEQSKLETELRSLKAFNGADEVTGPGVELTVATDLRPTDLLDLLNEVRNTGAEAIAIDGERVVFNTPVGGTQGQLLVNNDAIPSPVVIDAIGDADVLNQALARKGGMVNYLRTTYPNATITLETRASLTLPAYTRSFGIRPGA